MKIMLGIAILFYTAAFILTILPSVSRSQGKLSLFFILTGSVAHSIFMAGRIYASAHLPVLSIGETLVFYSWAVIGITLLVIWRYRERRMEIIMLPASAGAAFFSFLKLSPPKALPLILDTYWFEIHVIASFLAYALFTLGFAGSVFYIFTAKKTEFQEIALKSILWGFLFFSFSMFAGAVWGYLAWGTYWMWEPKILWSFIVWFWYAGALHVWYVRDWRERGMTIAGFLGFFIVIFTWLGVGLLMKSSHNF